MIRINNIRVPLDFDFDNLKSFISKKFAVNKINSVKLSKKSVDARKKSDVHFIISVDVSAENENKLLKKIKNSAPVEKYEYKIKYDGGEAYIKAGILF